MIAYIGFNIEVQFFKTLCSLYSRYSNTINKMLLMITKKYGNEGSGSFCTKN